MKPAGLILAAGESSRMGTDKALLPFGDTHFLGRLMHLFARHVSPVIVVLGHNATMIRAVLEPEQGVEIIVNPEYRFGQLSSFQAGILALPREAPCALVTLVDHPAVSEMTIRAMLERFKSHPSPLIVPRYAGRRGHPVLLGRALLDEILALPTGSSAKQVVHAHLTEDAHLDVDDPSILRDVDTPEDYKNLICNR